MGPGPDCAKLLHMTTTSEFDILVVGGGAAGLTATALFAQEGFRTLCVDRTAPVLDPARNEADLRTTALLGSSLDTLRRAGAWEALAPHATELATMRMVDAGGRPVDGEDEGDSERNGAGAARVRGPATVDFTAAEIDRPAFGVNVANTDLRAALLGRVETLPAAELRAPVEIRHLLFREDAAFATLSDGTRVRAKLVVAADGRASQVREQLGLRVRRIDYPQQAMVFVVAHAAPHQNVSTEILRTGGPFTLVPFRDSADGEHRSSVVWMESNTETDRLMALDDAGFEAAANERSQGVLGHLRLASRRVAWPMVSMIADRWHARRAALIAESAHVVPPVGAQGLNMSLKDAETLLDLLIEARAAGRDIGEEAHLARYTKARWPDAAARVATTAALNQATIGAFAPVRDLRRLGLRAVAGLTPVKQLAMRFGMGGETLGDAARGSR